MDIQAFPDRLAEAVERKRSQLVVGLDPRLDVLPMELRGEAVLGRAAAASAVARFCKGIVDAVGPYVVAVKPQAAFFEALGSDGMHALEEVCAYARSIGPARDPGCKARRHGLDFARVRRCVPRANEVGIPLADAITASPYLGLDAVEPFLAACRRHGPGVFFLVRTSNAGAADVQDAMLSDGRPLWQHLGDARARMGPATCRRGGAVECRRRRRRDVPRAVSEARRLMPQTPLLLPGVGAQGATPADVARAFTSGPASALVTASRSVIFAFRDTEEDWRVAAAGAAERLSTQVAARRHRVG